MGSKYYPIPGGNRKKEAVCFYEEDVQMIDVIRNLIKERSSHLEVTLMHVGKSTKAGLNDHTNDADDAFFVMNLGHFVDAAILWKQLLPRVHPFFAFKANNDPVLIYLMKELNFGFDCASLGEIQTVTELGVHPSKIIYANTHKQISHLRKAAMMGVDLATFDDESELFKIKQVAPNMRLLLRLSTAGYAKCLSERMTKKFGCPKSETKSLLKTARLLELNVEGVCFHIGIGAESPEGFAKVIRDARIIFSEGLELGFNMKILDIGGGFPSITATTYSALEFKVVVETIRESLDKEFPDDGTVQIIGEPGSYFTLQGTFLVASITGKRKGRRNENDIQPTFPEMEYFINDGTYSSFMMSAIVPRIVPVVEPVDPKYFGKPVFKSKLWGQSCADDFALEECNLPDMDVGDWLCFKDKGAYSATMSTEFNGFPPRPVFRYICGGRKMILDAFTEVGGFKCYKFNI